MVVKMNLMDPVAGSVKPLDQTKVQIFVCILSVRKKIFSRSVKNLYRSDPEKNLY